VKWFPQIGSGSVAQFPLTRSRRWRTISNELESGERVTLADQYANQIGWQLSYQDLSDAEAQKLANLFASCQGSAAMFGFADPTANLLGWSEDLTRPDWQAGLLVATAGANDPLGTQRAWSLANNTTGALRLQQTLGLSGDYIVCFSVWLRAAAGTTVVLQRDSTLHAVSVGTAWNRVFLSGPSVSGAANSTFGVAVNPGGQIQIFGPQAEAQPYPSAYKQTVTARGIYPKTRFAADELNIVNTSVGLSSCQIALRSQL
jgi:hypothetical protein